MSFFDSKEEVINIELTPYGKKLLLEGKFKPAYYTFHDDDIIYDIKYAESNDEIQLSSSLRILEESLYVKPQTRFTSVDNTNKKISPLDQKSDSGLINNLLGNSSLNKDYKPAWKINILSGEAESFEQKYTKNNNDLDIPQINLKKVQYEVKTIKPEEEKKGTDIFFNDKSALRIENTYVLLDISELNVDFEKESFDMELYEVKEDQNNEEFLEQIKFRKPKEYVVNNILLDESEVPEERIDENLTLADNYFNILVDDEISLEELSKEISSIPTKTVKPPFGEDC